MEDSDYKGGMPVTFLRCVAYFALLGGSSFILGRQLPKSWFLPDRFPYRCLAFEKEGRVYDRLHIRKWQNRIPDMSRIFPGLLPAKSLRDGQSQEKLERMIRETCVAECVHIFLAVAGFGCFCKWRSLTSLAMAILFALGNLPFILVQRYNRPRLCRLLEKKKEKTLCVY